MNQSLQSRLYQRLEQAPQRRAIAFYDAKRKFSWSSFEQLCARAAGYGMALAEQGLGRGDVCVILLPSGELAANITLGVLLLGAVPLLVSPTVIGGGLAGLPRLLESIIRRTRTPIVVCPDWLDGMRDELDRGHRRTRFLFGVDHPVGSTEPDHLPVVIPREGDVAAMQLTSGTTGRPRICVWDHRAVLAALDGMAAAMELSEEDVCFNWTPLYHDMGLVNNFFLCLTSGVPLALLNVEEFVKRPSLWMRGLSDTNATVSWSPNFGFALATHRVTDEELEGIRLDHVRRLWNAAERIHLSTVLAFHKRYEPYGLHPQASKTNFGCAENIGGATFSDPKRPFAVEYVDGRLLHGKRIARTVTEGAGSHGNSPIVSVGKANPGIQVLIQSRTGIALPDGHVGEITLRTPSRMQGYLGEARATQRALRGDLLRTGDLGYLRGSELFWVGRLKERINIRGKKLDPSDFEHILLTVEGLREGCFVAFGVDDVEQGTQRLIIVAEVREPRRRKLDEISAEIAKQCFLNLGVAVKEVLLVGPRTLPKTSSGKRRHRHFRRLYAEGLLGPYVEGAADDQDSVGHGAPSA